MKKFILLSILCVLFGATLNANASNVRVANGVLIIEGVITKGDAGKVHNLLQHTPYTVISAMKILMYVVQ
ncbi:hypothetical protein VPLG_00160 [Vibrio phage eugene 12A10]|uniref:hypothetical protein n=1 Tax=Vibrio phage eugene 12A10 TaxID=573172 RepID=UPI0003514CF5|nr:hypothetical protein VPLG_00160 [Vibrio phage eugene 12A10]AGN51599.1 hypothetical protein VPLG_00160 [Vibrio phage eugene 12A10]